MTSSRKAKSKRDQRAAPSSVPPLWIRYPAWTAFTALLLMVLVFYWKPLTSPEATPQWDAIDYHYSVQRFAAEELASLRLPQWVEYAYSGFAFLADPQVGVWYPLNWPFFLAGITPRSMQGELVAHALLACFGCWLLARLWLQQTWPAAVAALMYGFSGFFAGHASHTGMFQAAAWLPLLLYGVHVSMRTTRRAPVILTGVGCACMFLAGYFQTALYTFAAIALYAAAVAALEKRWLAAARVVAVCVLLTVALSAVQWLPTSELVGQSIRSGASFVSQTNSPLEPRALWTLISPNHYGSVTGPYTGPEDRTQFYFYAGILLLPLAAVGLAAGRLRWAALALAAPFFWYALGPQAGFYALASRLPGFGSVRAPVQGWFIVGLGLALLAGAGVAFLGTRIRFPWLAPALALIIFCDLYYWNIAINQLAYHHGSFEQRYGLFQDNFARGLRRALPAGTRFHAPYASSGFGPQNDAYNLRIPATYGYNPLVPTRYSAYLAAANANPNLVNALHAGATLALDTGAIVPNPAILPKFLFPKRLTAVGPGQAVAHLPTANPSENALVDRDLTGLVQDPSATVKEISVDFEKYVLESEAKTPSLLRTAIPWYPAWRAFVDGQEVPTRIVDHAMLGIPAPAGRHQIVLEFRAGKFRLGAAISLLAILGCLAFSLWQPRTMTRG